MKHKYKKTDMSHTSFSFKSSQLQITPVQLPVNTTMQDVFQHISVDNWSLLYDSGRSTESNSRYDIALWAPIVTLVTKQNETQICANNQLVDTISVEQTPPLVLAKQWFHRFKQNIDTTSTDNSLYHQLPLVIGLAGFCSYDLGRCYENLPATNTDEYECPDMALGIYDRALIHDVKDNAWYFCHTDNVATPDFTNWISASNDVFSVNEAWRSNLSKEQYTAALNSIHDYLVAGDCYQVNFAQRFSARFSGKLWQAYRQLTQANSVPFSAYMRVNQSYLLSLSPERFIQCRDGQIETKPIKGTRPRFADMEKDNASALDLLSAEKDRAENLMIVDLLRNDISKHSVPGSLKVPELFKLESYPAVHHMVSKITSTLLPDSHPLDLLAGCFPGGSITGAPKIRAMEIIEELEPNRRGIYCGSFVYLGIKNDLDSSICIRTLLAEKDQLYCWAGGGIVLDSNADDEYQETLDKVARILPVLEPVSG